jgi:hypothetical protein
VEEADIAKFVHLPDFASVFQAEITAMKVVSQILKELQTSKRNVAIYTDSQAAIMALSSNRICSKPVEQCRRELDTLSESFRVTQRIVSKIVSITTGHWPIGTQATEMNLPFNTHCRSCKDVRDKETLEHYICKCPALAKTRFRYLYEPFLSDISNISKIEVGSLVNYINATKWIP